MSMRGYEYVVASVYLPGWGGVCAVCRWLWLGAQIQSCGPLSLACQRLSRPIPSPSSVKSLHFQQTVVSAIIKANYSMVPCNERGGSRAVFLHKNL